jgi:hydantoinase/oxoprolinase-like protein
MKVATIPDLEVDPITLDIIENALRHARFEMDAVLFRSAMSPVIREQHDEFPMLTDPQGRMVVGQFGAYISEMMADWDRGIYPGDVILTSDPYKCSASISQHERLARARADLLRGRAGRLEQPVRAPDGRRRAPPGLPADRRDDDLRGGDHHPAAEDRRARRGAGGRPAADPQQRPPAGDEPGRPVRDRRRLPRRRAARDGAVRALRQGRLSRDAAGAAGPHARGDARADPARHPGGAADVRGLDRRRRPRQRPLQEEADDLARGRARLVRLVGHRPAVARPDQLLPLRGHVGLRRGRWRPRGDRGGAGAPARGAR